MSTIMLALFLVAPLAAPVAAKKPVVGCYVARVTPAKGAGFAMDVKLTGVPAVRQPMLPARAKRVVVHAPSGKRYKYAYWTHANGELQITFQPGMSGIRANVIAIKGGFRGTIEHFWDFPPYESNVGSIILKRVPCPSQRDST